MVEESIGSPKNAMEELVKQLLTLDEGERRAQLASLSEYTRITSTAATAPNEPVTPKTQASEKLLKTPMSKASTSGTSQGGRSGASTGSGDDAEGSSGDDSMREPSWLEYPPGLARSNASPKEFKPPPGISQEPPRKVPVAEPANKASEQVPGMEAEMQTSLMKALVAIGSTLPPQAAAVAQQLMAEGCGGGSPTAKESGRQRMQALQSFRAHLEAQQEESAQKIARILQAQRKEQSMTSAFDPTLQQMHAGQHASPWEAPFPMDAWASPYAAYGGFPDASSPFQSAPVPAQVWNAHGIAQRGVQPPAAFAPHGLPQRPRARIVDPSAPGCKPRIPKADAGTRQKNQSLDRAPRGAVPGQEDNSDFTLRTHLRELQKVDLGRIVLIRKISKLGFDSARMLEAHYSRYGKVEKVLVAHSHVKPQHCGQGMRLRPSGLGFVVMSSTREVEGILAGGEHQVVHGVRVCVRRFERRGVQEVEDEENDEEPEEK
jgi:hypothetical protein